MLIPTVSWVVKAGIRHETESLKRMQKGFFCIFLFCLAVTVAFLIFLFITGDIKHFPYGVFILLLNICVTGSIGGLILLTRFFLRRGL